MDRYKGSEQLTLAAHRDYYKRGVYGQGKVSLGIRVEAIISVT